jgi:hypothetical protein
MYSIYEIKGVKIGCTDNPFKRIVQQQKFKEYSILEEHSCIYEASKREIELQKQHGYPVDTLPYFKMMQMQRLTLRPDIVKKRSIGISKAQKGRVYPHLYTKEANLKKSLAKRGKIQHHMLTEEAKKKAAAKRKKPVIQLTKQGKYIKKWNSITEAAEANNTRPGQIINCIAKKYHVKSAGGYKWKYA